MSRLRSLALGIAIGLSATLCQAGVASSFFDVRITLNTGLTPVDVTPNPPSPVGNPANGICTSQADSDATHAVVRVVCSTGQFVSIDPAPGQPFTGTHGGAFRFNFGPGVPVATVGGATSFGLGAGTVTSLRILDLSGRDAPLEMLVSF
ncbi:MAG: hypothetical protein KIS62_18195 [Ramlibacter sp.]|nr:hypothetical protein [Ramlibacter sp.]MBX3656822.1 hypothetical protein [Ramlibacter sp.]MCW5651682.1 hypothetical protein [Ramlibacter sp.]